MKFKKKTLQANKALMKEIGKQSYYGLDEFIRDVKDYVAAIKERRMMCVIHSVSSSGMSRVISFHSCQKGSNNEYWYRQYIRLFEIMDVGSEVKESGHFRIHGCGMDMIFHTNYSIIHRLKNFGILDKAECDKLAQMTPTVF